MTLREITRKHLSFAERRHKNQSEIPCTVIVQKVDNGIPTELFKNNMGSIDEVLRYTPAQYHDVDIKLWYLQRNPLRYYIIIDPEFVDRQITISAAVVE